MYARRSIRIDSWIEIKSCADGRLVHAAALRGTHQRQACIAMKLRDILVVDDSDTDLLYTRIILEGAQVAEQVITLGTAQEALDHLQRPEGHRVDVILLDINMPEMDGFAFLRAYDRLHANQQARGRRRDDEHRDHRPVQHTAHADAPDETRIDEIRDGDGDSDSAERNRKSGPKIERLEEDLL